MDMDNALKRIKKCLALSKSSNEHESAAALRQAQKLMEMYGVTAEALAGVDVGEARAKSTACTKPAQWEHNLAHCLRRAFGCEVIIHSGWFNRHTNSNGALAEFVYIGLKHHALTASYSHDVLRRQVVKARAAYLKEWEARQWGKPALKDKIAAGDTFCLGFIDNIAKQVAEVAPSPEHKDAIQSLKTKLLGGEGRIVNSAKRGRDWGAYAAGREAGAAASLHRPMGKAEDQLRLN